jgi:hypothetical protein
LKSSWVAVAEISVTAKFHDSIRVFLTVSCALRIAASGTTSSTTCGGVGGSLQPAHGQV